MKPAMLVIWNQWGWEPVLCCYLAKCRWNLKSYYCYPNHGM